MKVTSVVLKRHVPTGEVTEDDFDVQETELSEDLTDGQLLVEVVYLSVECVPWGRTHRVGRACVCLRGDY
jgi:NADPH-dependent curcumin reductase CurA